MAWEVWNLWAVRTSISYSFRMPDIVSIKSRNTKDWEAIYGRQHLRKKPLSELTTIISLQVLSAILKHTTGLAIAFAPFRNNKPKYVVNRRVDIWKLTSASIWGNHTLEKRISDTLKVPDISLSPYPHFAVRLSTFSCMQCINHNLCAGKEDRLLQATVCQRNYIRSS